MQEEASSAAPLAIDTTHEVAVRTGARAVHERHGKIDVLINNAGDSLEFDTGLTPEMLGVEQLRATYETNAGNVPHDPGVCPAALALGEASRIINVSSTMGSLTALSDPASPYYALNVPAYNSSKSALNGLTVAYAKALAPKGIAVISICPGWVRTDFGTHNGFKSVEEGVQISARRHDGQSPDRRLRRRRRTGAVVTGPRRRPIPPAPARSSRSMSPCCGDDDADCD